MNELANYIFLLIVIFFSGQAFCDCNEKWTTILKTGKNGEEIYGKKRNLVDHIMTGSDIRFSLDDGSYVSSIQSASLSGDENVCVQALFHVSKNGPFNFQSNAYWWFLMVCTTGNTHMSRWSVGAHVDRGQTKTTYAVTWFARKFSCQTQPLYCNQMSGWRECGDISLLTEAMQNGAGFKAVYLNTGYVSGFTNVQLSNNGQSLAGQYPWHISQTNVGNRIEYQPNAYWWATIWSTSGRLEMSRWNVGEHVSRGHTNENAPMQWFVDNCWTLAYSHNQDGHRLDGSLDFLVGAVLSGRRVRIKIGDTYMVETDNLYVRNGHVSAQLLGHLSKDGAFSFQSDVYWYWQIASTTGNVETIRYNIGSSTSRGDSQGNQSMEWYIETRPWKKVLSTSSTGVVNDGSKSNLINAVQKGSQLRLVIQEAEKSYSIVEADNIAIEGNEVAAQSIRYISDEDGTGGIPRQFKKPPFWKFTLTVTDGNRRAIFWKVGEHTSLPNALTKNSVDWIVS
ncbi:uncharacterized protein LOC133196360 [Saccostrea echinata]|uniref:uncharacterized protein LOC133196360 n=1 Tax=Saccostrea echinata TaxID=191078 RepID=UPI002A833944|nr:uncharacterized protein LOC133196360 [Saccostrea echinata]